MTTRTRTLLFQVGSFALAGILLYLALRGVDLGAVWDTLRTADYRWLLPIIGIVLLSHLLRAWRWKVLLEALPPAKGAPARRVSLKTAFYSLMIGYMVNNAAPRVGEVARAANLSVRERIGFSSVFGTVVVERILDMAVLLVAIASVFVLFLDRLALLDRLFFAPIAAQLDRIPALALVGLGLALSAAIALVYRLVLRGRNGEESLWQRRIAPLFAAFRDGLLTLGRSQKRPTIFFTTLAMWACYLLMAYLPFLLLGMAEPFGLTLLDAWSIMIFGAIGIAVPSPGGAGSYHFITIQVLVHLFGVDPAPAASYAVISHGAQLILYTVVGALCLLLQGTSVSALRAEAAAAQEDALPGPSPTPDAETGE